MFIVTELSFEDCFDRLEFKTFDTHPGGPLSLRKVCFQAATWRIVEAMPGSQRSTSRITWWHGLRRFRLLAKM